MTVTPKPKYRTHHQQPPERGGFATQVADPRNLNDLSTQYMLADLAKSALVPEDMDAQIEADMMHQWVHGQYRIPYTGMDGKPVLSKSLDPLMYRVRRNVDLNNTTLLSYGKKKQAYESRRYDQPKYKDLPPLWQGAPYFPPAFSSVPFDGVLGLTEGEKKAAAGCKYLGLPCFGIGGKDVWRAKSGSNKLQSWIIQALQREGLKTLLLIPDGDIGRPDIARSYAALRYEIKRAFPDLEVLVPNMPDEDDKIDDLIVEWLAAGLDPKEQFELLPFRTSFREPIERLIVEYDLVSETQGSGDNRREVAIMNNANYSKLLNNHPHYDGLWHNDDTGTPMHGDEVVDQVVSSQLTNFMQDELSMKKAREPSVGTCIQTACYQMHRSPFMEGLRAVEWDGVHRLEGLFTEYCGSPDTPIVREVSAKWLPACANRLMNPGAPHQFMVITTGAPFTGKTGFASALVGKEHVVTLSSKDLGNPTELVRKIHTGPLILLDELSGFHSIDVEGLKAILTTDFDTNRRMRVDFPDRLPRRCFFYGTTNEVEFLNADPTGHRRMGIVPFGTELMDFPRFLADREQLWAEAFHVALEADSSWYDNLTEATEAAKAYILDSNITEATLEAMALELRLGMDTKYQKDIDSSHPIDYIDNVKHYGFKWSKVKELALVTATSRTWQTKDLKRGITQKGVIHVQTKTIDRVRCDNMWWFPEPTLLEYV